jgi:hypothetical protein
MIVRALPWLAAWIAASVPVGARAADPATSASRQPSIVGTWTWTRRSNDCPERYVYRPDGTVSVQSGEKRIEGTYLVAWAAEPNGRYRLTTTHVKDLGGRDCLGSTDDRTGQRSVVYVLFGQSQATMIQCQSVDGSDCIGPLRKTDP